MNALKRHVDSSVQKLETKSAEHQAALKTEFEVLKKQNKDLVKQNSEMLKMLKGLRSKT
jgi:predicted nucleotide-binding protein (sugar kinase/HSP70/actin superfamily)